MGSLLLRGGSKVPMEMKKEKIEISGGRTLIYYTFKKNEKKSGDKK
jgi:hypothetical protein